MMKMTPVSLVLLLFFAHGIAFSQTPGWEWARNAVGDKYDQATALATDPQGNVYIVGYFSSDSLLLGATQLDNIAPGFSEAYIAKYSPAGTLLWAQRAGGIMDDRLSAVGTDPEGNVYAAGYYYSPSITFGTFTLTNTGTADICLVKYAPDGHVIWAKNEGGLGVDLPHALFLDESGHMAMTGRFSSLSITFGTTTLAQGGSMDAFVVKYDTSGTVLWAKRGGGGSNDEGYSISGDAAGNLYVAGYFNQTATFGSVSLTTAGISDAFIAKYNDSGDVLWAAKAGGNSDDRARSVAADAQGNSYLAGYYTSASAAFGTVSLAGGAGDHSFVAKYAPDGTLVWAKALHGDSKAQAVAVYGENIYVCGGFSGDTLQVGPSLLLIEGNQDLYVARFDLSGTPTWGLKQNSGGESNEFATCLGTDGAGNLYAGGYFDSDPIAFGPSTLSNTRNGFDLFVARLGTGSTAVEEVDEAGFAIYPNPGAGAFTVESPVAISSIRVFSVRGEKIYSQDYASNALQQAIHLPSLPPGVYVVKVQAGERVYVRRLIRE